MYVKSGFLLLLLTLFACTTKQKELTQLDGKYSIHLDRNKETSIPLSDYFKNAKTIILETSDDCLIGHIAELQVFDEYIYVLDNRYAKSLFVFDMEGRFIRKIGSLGNGPGEYIQPNDFTFDAENRFLYLLDNDRFVYKYSLDDGAFVQTITPELPNARINFIQYHKGNLYLSVTANEPNPNDFMLLEASADDGKIQSSHLPVKENKGWSRLFFTERSFFMSRLNGTPRYNQLFMNNIMSLGEEITPYIQLRSVYLTTEKDLETANGGIQATEMMFMSFKKIWNIHSFIENDDFIFFKYIDGLWSYNLIYDKNTEEIKITKNLYNDLVFKDDRRNLKKFVFYDTKGAYEIMYGIEGTTDYYLEAVRNNEAVPDLDRIDELLELKDAANPIIFYYEFK